MGLINHDSFSTPYGIDVTDSYMSIATNNLEVSKDGTEYKLLYITTIWNNETDRETNKRSLKNIVRSITLNSVQLEEGVYEVAYADLKTVFPNTTDA
tara:strand:+ start:10678 stop:10968 length:291 start_codon:yes stop_codon:yes gene_type:complete